MRRNLAVLFAACAAVVLASEPALAQCVMCRLSLQSGAQQTIAAFRSGILILLVAPFAVFGTVAILAARRFGRR